MAELLGIIAGGAGLASLTIQLAESAQKLRSLHRAYAKAPQFLEDVAFDLETFNHALDRLMQSNSDYSAVDVDLVERCVQRCRRSSHQIAAMVTKLEEAMQKSRALGRLRTAFETHEIAKLETDLERTKNSLNTTLMLYLESCRRYDVQQFRQILHTTNVALIQQGEVIQAHGKALQSCSNRSPTESSRILNRPSTNSSSKTATTLVPHKRNVLRASRIFKKYNIVLPMLFTSQTWSISFGAAQFGWRMQLTTWNEVPIDSPVFDACREGNLLEVRRLFQEGLATACDYNGRRRARICPLGAAMESGNLELCEFLVTTMGDGFSNDSSSASDMLCHYVKAYYTIHNCKLTSHFTHQIYRLFFERLDLGGDDLLDLSGDRISEMEWWNAFSDIECWRILRQSLSLDWAYIPWHTRFSLAMRLTLRTGDEFLEALGHDVVDEAVATTQDYLGNSALHLVARQAIWFEQLWKAFMLDLLRANADIHCLNSDSVTPLIRLLNSCSLPLVPFETFCSDCLLPWLEVLQSAGVDLVKYGSTEMLLWRRYIEKCSETPSWQDPGQFEWSYGAQPKDWRVWKQGIKVSLWNAELVLSQLPGHWPSPAVPWPAKICWSPEAEDELDQPWMWVLRNSFVVPTAPQQPSIWSTWANEVMQSKMTNFNGIQDDASAITVELEKSSRVCNRPRSTSALTIPSVRLYDQYWDGVVGYFPGRSWLPNIHICCPTGRIAIGERVSLRRCTKQGHNDDLHAIWKGSSGIDAQMRRFRLRYQSREELRALPYSAYAERLSFPLSD